MRQLVTLEIDRAKDIALGPEAVRAMLETAGFDLDRQIRKRVDRQSSTVEYSQWVDRVGG